MATRRSNMSQLVDSTDLPKEVLLSRTDVLWEVLAIQLKPKESEVDALLALLPSQPSNNSSLSNVAASLDSMLQWTQPSPADASAIVLQTLRDLGIISTLQLNIRDLARLILSIKNLYRLPDECAYHNWAHASAVAHYACILAYRLELIRRFASPLPVFALIIAALCHDMDHRGTTNLFHANQQTSICQAYLYSCTHLKPAENSAYSPATVAPSENKKVIGPLLEVHHITLFHGLFKYCYPHILDKLSANDSSLFLKLVEVIVLATDLVAHPRVVQQAKLLRPADLTSSAPFPLNPILSLFIGACDLNATARDWLSSLKAARDIYAERAKEESLSSTSFPAIRNIGNDQCHFVETFVRPIFVEISRLFPTSHPAIAAVDSNLSRWRKLSNEHASKAFTTDSLADLILQAEEESRSSSSAAKSPPPSMRSHNQSRDNRKASPRQTRRAVAAVAANKRPKQSIHH